MQYIKATKEKCEAYNQKVSKGENYQGSTTQWANIQEIEGSFYIALNPKYKTELTIVNELPNIEFDEETSDI